MHDHLLFPTDTTGSKGGGARAPLWIPLPPRALNADALPVEHLGAAPLSSYEIRLEYVCLAAQGCGNRKVSLLWAPFNPSTSVPLTPFAGIPPAALLPTQSEPEQRRRALAESLQDGWGTFYHPSMLTWVLLPESFAVKVGLYRLSTQAFLSPEGLTIDPVKFHQFAITAGLHSYDNSCVPIHRTGTPCRPMRAFRPRQCTPPGCTCQKLHLQTRAAMGWSVGVPPL